jgi:hypothetical protein
MVGGLDYTHIHVKLYTNNLLKRVIIRLKDQSLNQSVRAEDLKDSI